MRGHPPGPRMRCGWGCGAQFTGRNMRALHIMREAAGSLRRHGPTMAELASQGRTPTGAAHAMRRTPRCPAHGEPSAGAFQRQPRMPCGWGCGAQLTGRNMRAHFTICPKRPAASGDMERRRGTLKVKGGRPPSPRMLCGCHCGTDLTGRNMRAHFTICANRPAGSDHVDRRGWCLPGTSGDIRPRRA
jgi:hypothetical protein